MTVLRFAGFTLDTVNRELRRGGTLVPAEPKVLECVELLLRRAGQLVTTEELRRALWPDVTVGTDAMRQVIYGARKALGDRGNAAALIRNRKRLGYVFAGEVSLAEPRREWPFVGREREVTALHDVVASLQSARGPACLISGSAGTGKSALVNRLREHASTRGVACAVGHCREGIPAFWPFREMARSDASLPDPASLTAGATDPEQRFLACDAFVNRLRERATDQGPLLVVVEDLHWADDGTLLVFEWLARGGWSGPLAVAGTYRPDDAVPGSPLGRVLARLSGREGTLDLHLGALTTDDLIALLTALAHPSANRRGAEAMLELTGGNPLFLRQVLQWTAQATAPKDVLRGGLRHVVLERAAHLPSETQDALRAAAVLGSHFSTSLLCAMKRAPLEPVLSALQPAIVAHLVEFSDGELRFSHSLLRDAVYDALPASEREALHARALAAWSDEAPGAARTAAMAAHAFRAGEAVSREQRFEWCERAGREAFDALSFDQAAVHLEHALSLCDGAPPSTAAELALLAARSLWEADSSDPASAFLRAADLARRAGTPLFFAQAAIGFAVGEDSVASLANARWKPENLAILEEALALLEGAPRSPAQSNIEHRVARALAAVRGAAGDHAGAHAAATIASARAPSDDEPWMQLQNTFYTFTGGLWLTGSDGGATVIPDIVSRSAHPLLREWQRLEACALRMSVALLRGDMPAYREAYAELGQRTAALPEPPPLGKAGDRLAIYAAMRDLGAATLAIIEGRFAEAEELLGAAAMPRGSPAPRVIQEILLALWFQIRGYQGRRAELEPEVNRRLREFPEDAWHLSIARAEILVDRGDTGGALEAYDVVRRTGFCVPYNGRLARAKPDVRWRMVELCLAIGDTADAAVLFQSRGPGAHYFIADGVAMNLGSSSRPMGELAAKLGRLDDAAHYFRQAVEMNDRMGHRPEMIRSRLCLARALQDRDRPREARALIASARADAAALGMSKAVALAEHLTARA